MLTVNDRDRLDWREGMTVQEALDVLGYEFAMMIVTVDGELVPEEDYAGWTLTDGADLKVIHLAHGG